MKPVLGVVKIGTPMLLESPALEGPCAVLFEDDGDTGYFYAVERTSAGPEMLDALHIYNAEQDLRGVECRLELVWSSDGRKAGLRLNGTLWAAFDFEHEEGRCRSNFPPPGGRWQMAERPAWSDAVIRQF